MPRRAIEKEVPVNAIPPGAEQLHTLADGQMLVRTVIIEPDVPELPVPPQQTYPAPSPANDPMPTQPSPQMGNNSAPYASLKQQPEPAGHAVEPALVAGAGAALFLYFESTGMRPRPRGELKSLTARADNQNDADTSMAAHAGPTLSLLGGMRAGPSGPR